MKLPSDYINYLKNGGDLEFEVDQELGDYIILEPMDSIEQYNEDIEINEYAPGYLAFGCDGGGEAFVFDDSGQIYLMPMIGMSPSAAVKIAESWSDYIDKKRTT